MCIKMMYNTATFKNVFQYQTAKSNSANLHQHSWRFFTLLFLLLLLPNKYFIEV